MIVMMSEEAIRQLTETNQRARAQLHCIELRAMVARFADHVERVGQGQSPGIESRLEELRGELAVAEEQLVSVAVQPGGNDRAREIAEARARLAALEKAAER